MSDQKLEQFKQLLGADLSYTFDFSDWLDDQGLVGQSATASVVSGTSVSITSQSFSNPEWTGLLAADSTGFSTVEVVLTPTTGSQRRHRRFCIEVTDPSCA